MGKKLNLQWVTKVIGEDYKKWEKGDVVRIKAQTGTGKTLMVTGNRKIKGIIDRMESYEKLIYICNRIELKRQIKLDLLKKFNLEIVYKDKKQQKIDSDWLDEQTAINNVVITSYHAIANGCLDNQYLNEDNNLDRFDYIICDECHFFLTDSAFNNKTRIAFNELVRKRHKNAIKIFISATMEEVSEIIEKAVEDIKNTGFGSYSDINLHKYDTGIDYSYLNIKYFTRIEDIGIMIKNDKSDDKWIIFVTSNKKGIKLKEELLNKNITTEFINAGSNTKEAKLITSTSKYTCKVLICTKCLDNGVNIKDEKVKNVVVMAHDKVTFIQELGRKRFEINNAPDINLFIPVNTTKVFRSLLECSYKPKLEDIELYEKEIDKFNRKYDNDLNDIPSDLFYRENKDIKINILGYSRLIGDYNFAEEMIKKLKKDKFAFVKEQLSWLGLEHTFNEMNLIQNIVDEEEIKTLEEYLDSIVGKKLFNEEHQKLSDMIVKELISIETKKDYRTKKLSASTMENIIRKDLGLKYVIGARDKESKGENRGKRYIILNKIN